MEKQMKENKWQLVVSSLVILLLEPAGWILEGKLSGMPLALLATHWICILFTFHDRKNKDQNKKAMGLVLWTIPALSLFYGAVNSVIQSGGGSSAVFSIVLYFGFGLIFAVFGNYLPKVRQNRTIGIKVKWALENEENWNATHRFSGKLWMAAGILSMVCALFPDLGLSALVFGLVIAGAALIPCLYSYVYYRKQLKEGRAELIRTGPGKKAVTALITLGTAVFVVWVLFAGSMEIVWQDTSFTIETVYWSDLTVEYRDIEAMEYQETDASAGSSGSRTNGFGNLRLSMGSFENTVYGDYTRYTYASCDSCVVLTVKGETVVINGPDDAATRTIYEKLEEKCLDNYV